jgi:hypothetical protein
MVNSRVSKGGVKLVVSKLATERCNQDDDADGAYRPGEPKLVSHYGR